MTNDSIFQFLYNCIQDIIQKASDFKIYIGPSYSVSVLQFFIALAIMSIVLRSLVNFASFAYMHSSAEIVAKEAVFEKKNKKGKKNKK